MQRVTFEIEYNYDYPIDELEEYLNELDGIIDVKIDFDDLEPIFDIKYDESKITYKIILYEICAFCGMPYQGSVWSWDTHPGKNAKSYELNLDGLICDICYAQIVDKLFNTPGILSFLYSHRDFWKNDTDKLRIKLLYDDKIISEEKLNKLCTKLKEDHC